MSMSHHRNLFQLNIILRPLLRFSSPLVPGVYIDFKYVSILSHMAYDFTPQQLF